MELAKHGGWLPGCRVTAAQPCRPQGPGAPARLGSSGQGACGPRGAQRLWHRGFSFTWWVKRHRQQRPAAGSLPWCHPPLSWLPAGRGASGETARRSSGLSGHRSPAPLRFVAALYLLCQLLHGSRHFPQPLPVTPTPHDSLINSLYSTCIVQMIVVSLS